MPVTTRSKGYWEQSIIPPINGAAKLYEPLVEITEAVTAEKGGWIWEKEPY